MEKELVRITLRLPKKMWEKVKKESKENERRLNSEIINKLKK